MSNRRFAECVAIVLRHEGGFVEHPRDHGGATKYGITLNTLRGWRGDETLTADDVRALTEAEAREIYLARYWNPIRGDELPPGVDLAVFDYAVNSGVRHAARELQAVLGVPQDGAIGRVTLAAVRDLDANVVISNLCERRRAFLRTLGTFETFGRGWLQRVEEIEEAAKARIAAPPLTIREAQGTDTVQVATQVTTVVAPLAAGVPSLVSAFGGLHPVVGVSLIAAGLVVVVAAGWFAASWLRSRRI
jgi:lysozyme family protein